MIIPASIRIRYSVEPGTVFYFHDEQLSSNEPHYFILLNGNPSSDKVYLLLVASSRVEKRKDFIKQRNLPQSTLVIVEPSHFKPFTKETAIDCNFVLERTIETLEQKLSSKALGILEKIDESILARLIQGVKASPQISQRIKNSLM